MLYSTMHGPIYGPRYFPARCNRSPVFITYYEEPIGSEADAHDAQLDAEARVFGLRSSAIKQVADGNWNLCYSTVVPASQMQDDWGYCYPRTGKQIPGLGIPATPELTPPAPPLQASESDWFIPERVGMWSQGYSGTTAGQWVDKNTGTPLQIRKLADGSYVNIMGTRVSQFGISV